MTQQEINRIAEAVREKMNIDDVLQQVYRQGLKTGADYGAKAAVRAVEREREKIQREHYDWQFHNAKLLLRNYRRLKSYLDRAVYDAAAAEEEDTSIEEIIALMENRRTPEEILSESIRKNYVNCKIVMVHVEQMLEAFREESMKSKKTNAARRWRVLEQLYLTDEPLTVEEVAEAEHIDERTVHKDIDACATALLPYLFGVDGMDKM